MRIGSRILDLESLTPADLSKVIQTARAIRDRKLLAEELQNRFNELFQEAKENGFDFVDCSTGQILNPDDYELYDNR